MPDGDVHPIAVDVTDREALRRSFPGRVDNVVYMVSPDRRVPEAYETAYERGPSNVVHVLAQQPEPPRRLVFVSSTRVYGQGNGEWVDESSAVGARDFAGRALIAGERTAREAPCPVTVVRLAGIYGPGRTREIDLVKRGRAECLDGVTDYTNRIHRDDAAGSIAHLLVAEGPVPETMVGVDSEPAPRCDVYRWLAGALHVPPPLVTVATRRGAGGKRCRNTLLLRIGYRLSFPTYREGYGALLEEAALP